MAQANDNSQLLHEFNGNIDDTNIAKQGISLGMAVDNTLVGKLNAYYQVFTSSGTPDAENTVAHSLNRTPVGYIVVSQNKAGSLYAGSTAWDSTNIYLKSNIASVAFTIIIF